MMCCSSVTYVGCTESVADRGSKERSESLSGNNPLIGAWKDKNDSIAEDPSETWMTVYSDKHFISIRLDGKGSKAGRYEINGDTLIEKVDVHSAGSSYTNAGVISIWKIEEEVLYRTYTIFDLDTGEMMPLEARPQVRID